MLKKVTIESAAEGYLELLASRGVEYFFGNAGTDFAPIIEAYAKRAAQGQVLPRPITVPHEITAIGMAHGYAMVTGRPQVVMVHVIVGTANALGGIINAARAHAPILVTAGRTPLTEDKLLGRSVWVAALIVWGLIANALGFAALEQGLAPVWKDTVVMVATEFGRTAAVNGTVGTDHGTGTVAFLVGGAVKGGKVHGTWPGLEREQLYEGRDLALTTDFRAVFADILTRHLGANNLAPVFPGYDGKTFSVF